MLKITVPLGEAFDEATSKFVVSQSFDLELEHSLVSLSKWEESFEKPFLSGNDKTAEETLAYVKAMTLTPDVPPEIFLKLSKENVDEINAYVNANMTATTFRKMPQKPSREIITSEIIYYWMVSMQIPFECQYWHLNKLITLIKVCNEKNKPAKKMGKREALDQQRALNTERQQKFNTRG